MPRVSAGLLMYRRRNGELEVLLVHPGGPFFRNQDAGHWTIPKGEPAEGEELLAAALREFEEETGFKPEGAFTSLAPVKQKGGKVVHAWAFEGDCDPTAIRPNSFTMEWPPRSGKQASFPEIDRAEFFGMAAAREKINAAQVDLLEELESSIEQAGQE